MSMKKIFIFLTVVFMCTKVVADEKLKWALYDVVEGTRGFHDGLARFWNSSTQKYGFIDSAGEIAIEAQFDKAEDFENGQAIVTTDTGMGIVNRSGHYLLEPKYKEISREGESANLYIIIDSEGKKGVFFNNRIVIPPIEVKGYYSTFLFPFVNNVNVLDGKIYSEVRSHGSNVRSGKVQKGNEVKTVYFDVTTGQEIDVSPFRESSKGLVAFQNGNKYGLKNANTQKVFLEPKYNFLSDFWINDHIIASIEDVNAAIGSKSFFIDANGKILFEADLIMETKNDNYIVNLNITPEKQYLYGLYSTIGEVILPIQYSFLFNVTGDWFWYRDGNESAIINVKTKKKYIGDSFSCSEDMIRVLTTDLTSFFINAKTGERLSGNYEFSNIFSEGLAVVQKKGTKDKVIIDRQGRTLLSENDGVSISGDYFSEGVIAVYYNGHYGYIYNPTGYNNDYVYNSQEAIERITEIRFQEGMEAMRRGHYAEAKEIFYRIMMNDPNNGNAINNYGTCLYNLGYKEEALEAFTIAYDIDSNNIVAKEKIVSIEKDISQQKVQENNQSGTFWDALASFGNLLGQIAGSYEGYNIENSFTSNYNSVNSDNYNSFPQRSPSSYQMEYSKWEDLAQKHFNSITNLGVSGHDKKGNIGGDTLNSMSGSAYVQMKKSFREAQRQMRSIRNKAQRNGINIPQSKWETASISY